jgi:hypothetical protein
VHYRLGWILFPSLLKAKISRIKNASTRGRGIMTTSKRDSLGQEDEKWFYQETLRGERAIIGAVVLDNSLMKHAHEHLSFASFNILRHQPIFAAMVELDKRKEAISIQSILDELRSHGKIDAAGGEEYVTTLDEDVPKALTVGQQDYADRFVLLTISKAASAAALSEDYSAEDVARIFFEKAQKFRALKGWTQSPLLKEGEGDTN